MNAVAPAVLPRQLRPQHVPALHKLVELGEGYWVEAGNAYGFHFSTLRAMARLGYVSLGRKSQSALHCRAVTYQVAYLTATGAAAYAAHAAWVQARNDHDKACEQGRCPQCGGADLYGSAAEGRAPGFVACFSCRASFDVADVLAAIDKAAQAVKDDRDEHDALRGVKWVAGCPLPLEMCDPDIDHDHDPLPPAFALLAEFADVLDAVDARADALAVAPAPVAADGLTAAQDHLAELLAERAHTAPARLGPLNKRIAEQAAAVAAHQEVS